MGKVAGSVRPGWPWFQPRHHGATLPKGKQPCPGPGPARALAALHSRPAPLPRPLSTDTLVKCGGTSLLIQSTSWLLLLLLSLPLLQAMDFVSL